MIFGIFVVLFLGIIFWRVILPGMRLENARRAAANADAPNAVLQAMQRLASVNLWTVVLIVVGLVVLYFGVYSSSWKTPKPTEIGEWSPRVWFWLVVIWGIGASIVAINWHGATAKTLQTILAAVMITLVVIAPVWRWASSPSTKPATTASTASPGTSIPLAHNPDGTMTDYTKWPKLVIPAGVSQEVEVPDVGDGYHPAVYGNDFQTRTERWDKSVCITDATHTDCPQSTSRVKKVVVINNLSGPNPVWYAKDPVR